MRIVRRKAFLKLPADTIYATAPTPDDINFGVMHVKAGTLASNDFVCLALNDIEAKDSGELMARYDAMLEDGASFPLRDSFGRDGMFADDEIYLVYESADLERIVRYCQMAIAILRCPYCDEPNDAPNEHMPHMRAHHRECILRMALGSAAHIEERCSCYVPGSIEGDAPGLSLREGARLAVAAWKQKEGR
jgi:hypothetical protein